jgi:hypothetical protein
LFFLLCRSRCALYFARILGRRAPRARCDQIMFSSKPGGFILTSPELGELTVLCYAHANANASEKTEKLLQFSSMLGFLCKSST